MMSRAEQSRAEQSRAEQSRAEQSRAEQSRAEQASFVALFNRLNELNLISRVGLFGFPRDKFSSLCFVTIF